MQSMAMARSLVRNQSITAVGAKSTDKQGPKTAIGSDGVKPRR